MAAPACQPISPIVRGCVESMSGKGASRSLGALLGDGVPLVLLLLAAGAAARHGRCSVDGLVHDKAGVALFRVPLKAREVGLVQLVV